MRAVAVSVWIFINLVFVGMCGYIYLLWSQYWRYVERQHLQMSSIMSSSSNGNSGYSNNQIFYYQSSASESFAPVGGPVRDDYTVPKHHVKERRNKTVVTIIRRHSQPRFPKMRNVEGVDSDKLLKCNKGSSSDCLSDDPSFVNDKLSARVAAYKSQLVVQLRRVLLEESSVFKARGDASNPYDVQYVGPRGSYQGRTVKELVCELKQAITMRTLSASDQPFNYLRLGAKFPDVPLLGAGGKHYNTCAIVTNAGSLDSSSLGNFIDSHDLILRFNHAPTEGHENDVGSKTTIRMVNSQVVSKPKFGFLNSPLFHNVSLLVWDPSNYTATLEEWYLSPDFDLFTPYFMFRDLYPEQVFHILDPHSLWSLWDYIQGHIPVRIRKNPPSSGFLGLALLLPHCSYVDLFEYVPSVRLTKRCHYWDVAEDLSCTFGVWHPLAAEKLLTLALNIVDDTKIFSDGYVRVPGYNILNC